MKNREIDIAWAAGLFEGEGCIECRQELDNRDNRYYLKVALRLQMTDEDIVRKFGDIIGGRQVRWRSKTSTGKDVWDWSTGKRSEILRILDLFLPYLGERRTNKALETISAIHKQNQQPRKPFSPESIEKISKSVKKFWAENREYMLEKQSKRVYKKRPGKGLPSVRAAKSNKE